MGVFKVISPFNGARWGLFLLSFLSKSTKIFLALLYRGILDNIAAIGAIHSLSFAGIALALILLAAGLDYYCKVMIEKKRQNIIHDMQRKMIASHQEIQLSELEQLQAGDWMTLFMEDTEKCSDAFSQVVLPVLEGMILFVVSLVIGFSFSMELTTVILVCSFLSVAIPSFFSGKIEKHYKKKMDEKGGLQNYTINSFTFLDVLKSFQVEKKMKAAFTKGYTKYARQVTREKKYSAAMTAVSIGSGFTISTLWMVFGVYLILESSLDIGAFVAFLTLSDYFNWPFFSLSERYEQMVGIVSSYKRYLQFISSEKEEGVSIRKSNEFYRSKVIDMSYYYNGEENLVFDRFNLAIQKDEKIAILGKSGTGKTTLMKLLMGLYYPMSGSVTLYTNEMAVQKKSIQKHISYVSQVPILFQGTVYENLALGDETIPKEAVYLAAERACAASFIERLPQGYQTVIGGNTGQKLSGGQLQRLSIARAFIKNASLYIFDEFSSNLDEENEEKIIDSLKDMEGAMVFVTHKKDILSICDTVIDLDLVKT